MNTIKLPEPVIIPGIMDTLRSIKDRMSCEMMDMSYEDLHRYLNTKGAKAGNNRQQPKCPVALPLA
jgi:hypothetical protein